MHTTKRQHCIAWQARSAQSSCPLLLCLRALPCIGTRPSPQVPLTTPPGINGLSRQVEAADGSPALGPCRLTSGVCGDPIRQEGLRFVQQARQVRGRVGERGVVLHEPIGQKALGIDLGLQDQEGLGFKERAWRVRNSGIMTCDYLHRQVGKVVHGGRKYGSRNDNGRV